MSGLWTQSQGWETSSRKQPGISRQCPQPLRLEVLTEGGLSWLREPRVLGRVSSGPLSPGFPRGIVPSGSVHRPRAPLPFGLTCC